jgi:hypothetical protein
LYVLCFSGIPSDGYFDLRAYCRLQAAPVVSPV